MNKIDFINASYLLSNNEPTHSYGVSIFDIDGDDDPEIIVANSRHGNVIYKYSEENNCFIDVAPENFKQKNNDTINICVGDFLGNGAPSIYMLHSDTFGGLK
ncbi:MAG: FG-GAP-like repeat-containing protein, partial [Bdellovibrionota bacterium]